MTQHYLFQFRPKKILVLSKMGEQFDKLRSLLYFMVDKEASHE